MASFNAPAALTKEVAQYDKFRGVDFSTDPALCDRGRSPFAPNLISDAGGMPEKREGWRTVLKLEAPINGLFYDEIAEQKVYVAHGGTKLYKWTPGENPPGSIVPPSSADWKQEGTFEVIKENVNNARSTSFTMGDNLFVLTGAQIMCYGKPETPKARIDTGTGGDSEVLVLADITSRAYVPLTSIARTPAGAGTAYEQVNLLTGKRKNAFLCDGTADTFKLDCDNIDANSCTAELNGEPVDKAKMTVDEKKGTVKFATIPPKPTVVGRDNLEITFCKTNAENAEKILKCTIATTYANRVFLSGNSKMPDMDFRSELNNPFYFPDLGYTRVGSGGTIMGYAKIAEYLAIIKHDNDEQSTIFLRNEATLNNETVFPVRQGVSGAGAISKYSFGNILGEPLFLSRKGILGIASNNVTAEKSVQNRSYYIDSQLMAEERLERAVACSYGGYYILAVNNRCYILDGKQSKSYRSQSLGDYLYECYTWDNMPVSTFLEVDGSLYFGTEDGRVCRMNTDMTRVAKYSDDGEPIVCAWSTKADDDGSFMQYKTMCRRGCGVLIKPYVRSSVKVNVRANNNFGQDIQYATMDIFDWEDLDFSRITFDSNDTPQVVPFNRKIKKYVTLQITVKNDGLNEGFGVYGITKMFTRGNVVK